MHIGAASHMADPPMEKTDDPARTDSRILSDRRTTDAQAVIAVYLAITGLSAAAGLVIEIVAGRMIAPYLGMSLYTWTAVIAVVLAGFTAGHWVGGWLAEKPSEKARVGVIVSLLLAGLSALLSLVLLRTLSGPVINLGLSAVPTILILTSALFFMPSFFVGIPSPVLTKLAIDAAPGRMGTLLGAFYAVGAFGSIAGTLAAGYFFISYLGSIRTVLTVAALYFVMAAVLFVAHRRLAGASIASAGTVAPAVAVAAALGGIGLAGHGAGAFVSHCKTESAYYCIRVLDVSDEIGIPARTMVLDHLGHGTNLRDRPALYVSPYLEAQDALQRLHIGAGKPFAAYFIGGGAYTLPRGWLVREPGSRMVVAEIDPDVTSVARSDFWVEEQAGLVVRHRDARRALENEPAASFEVIVGDAFHDIAVPQHLVTSEFFKLVRSRLKPGGIYLMNVIDGRERPRLTLSIAASLERAFPVVEVWRPYSQGGRQTYVILASETPTPKSRLYSRVSPDATWDRVGEEELAGLAAAVDPIPLTDDFAPVDRLIGIE